MKIALLMALTYISLHANAAESQIYQLQQEGTYFVESFGTPDFRSFLDVLCEPGDIAISGGCETINVDRNLPLTRNIPMIRYINGQWAAIGWSCALQPSKINNHPYGLKAIVICKKEKAKK